MNITEAEEIEQAIIEGQEYPEESKADAGDRAKRVLVQAEWESGVADLRARAIVRTEATPEAYRGILIRYWRVCERLFEALHSNWMMPSRGEEPKDFWAHRSFNFLLVQKEKRGFDLYWGELIEVVAWYLDQPELRTDRLDWIFLDAIIFSYLDSLGRAFYVDGDDRPTNWAALYAEGSVGKYVALAPLVWLVRIALRFLLWPALGYYLYSSGYERSAGGIVALWALYLLLKLVTLPWVLRARGRKRKLLAYLGELYAVLGQRTISPRKLREKLDAGVSVGFTCDGAAFSIVDRMLARDPTTFIPSRTD